VIVPVPLGAVNATLTAVALETVAVPMVGEPDIVVLVVDADDESEVPLEFVAVTVNV
jgi:hypothetical protein